MEDIKSVAFFTGISVGIDRINGSIGQHVKCRLKEERSLTYDKNAVRGLVLQVIADVFVIGCQRILILYLYTEKEMKNTEIADKLSISVADVDMIITKIIRSEHKNKVPESPLKTIL